MSAQAQLARRKRRAYTQIVRASAHHRYTYDEYARSEAESALKHEFLDGEMFAMAGGTPEHAALGGAVIRELGNLLEGKPCRVYTSDLRVRVMSSGLVTYPDAAVICGELQRDPADKHNVVNPAILVEVTSDSSEEYDRGEKFAHFREISSLSEYVVVSHRERLIEVFSRGADGDWSRSEARKGAVAQLSSLGGGLSVDRVYAGGSL